MDTVLLNAKEVEGLISIEDIVDAVREGFRAYSQGKVAQPPIVSIETDNGGEVDFKTGYSRQEEIIGFKMAGGFWDNPKKYDLASTIAMICLFDGKNGVPICVMDGTLITAYRTAAAGALGAICLARKNSRRAAVIGTGAQARMQIRALEKFFPLEEVSVYGRSRCEAYVEEMSALLPRIEFTAKQTVKEAVEDADIIVTATAGRQALVMDEWIKPGTHINAIGCDMEGKQELDPEIFRRAKVVNDSREECVKRGETQHAFRKGYLEENEVYGEIGEIHLGEKKGRISDEEITIFDATGMSVQEINSALFLYRKALRQNVGRRIDVI